MARLFQYAIISSCVAISCGISLVNVIDVTRFGAIGDGKTDDTQSIRRAIASCNGNQSSPAVVLFPPDKIFLSGPVNITSYTTLQIDGVLRAINGNNTSPESSEFYIRYGGWPQIAPLPSYGVARDNGHWTTEFQGFVYSNNASDIAIVGSGTIDGSGNWWWWVNDQLNRTEIISSGRPNLIQFVNCTNIEIAGVTMRDPAFWCVSVNYCTDAHIHHITIRSRMYSPNTDGVDPDSCQNVLVEHNDISCGDDAIAIKSGLCGPASPNNCNDEAFTSGRYQTKNVTVRNNIFRIGMGIAIGSTTSGGIKDVYVHDNVIGLCKQGHCEDGCCGWGPALHVKTTLTRGGVTENIVFKNNSVYNTSMFILVELGYQSHDSPPKDYPPTKVRGITFIDNKALGGGVGANWDCSPFSPCDDIIVINNRVDSVHNPWNCHNVKTYNVSGNSPTGLRDCMYRSMHPPMTNPAGGSDERQF